MAQLPYYQGPKAPPPFNPATAMNGSPLYYPYQIGAQDPSLSFNPDLQTNDPNRIFRNAQNVSYNLGAGIDSDLYGQGQQYGNLWGQYGNAMNDAYGQLAQNPGYTDQQSNNIIRDRQYNSLVAGQDRYDALDPTAKETAGMTGNTGSYKQYFNPQDIYDTNAAAAAQQRNAVDLSETGMRNATNDQKTGYNQAIDPSKLQASNAYFDQNSNVLNSTSDRLGSAESGASKSLNDATSNPNLGISGEYGRQAGMSDAEVREMADAGARDVGLRYNAAKGDAERRAAAGGNTSALAVGAQEARLGQQAATQSADARVNAELAARAAQRQAATGVESTRLGAEQYQTGAKLNAGEYLGSLGSQNAQYQGNLGQSAVQNAENTRLGAQQNLTNTQLGAATNIGNAERGNAQYTGSLRAGTEANIGGNNMAGQQYVQGTGTGINMAQDQTAAGRAAQQYGIRQGNQQYGINNQYSQGMGVNNALSSNYGKVADATRADQQEYRNFTAGQTGQYLGAQQNNNQQRIGNYGTMTGAMNNNANAWNNYTLQKSAQPGLFDKIAGVATGAAKAYFGG